MSVVKAIPCDITWHQGLSIFASEPFLRAVSDDYGWIGGVDERGALRCILPYTVSARMGVRLARFRVETIVTASDFDVDEERLFLGYVKEYLRAIGADFIIPPTTNAIFRTYPNGADAAPYGSYVVDLTQPEELLWRGIDRITRQNISSAEKSGVSISIGAEYLDVSYALIRETFKRSSLPFMGSRALDRYVQGLGEQGKVVVAKYQGAVQSCVVFAFSQHCAYAVYGGNIERQRQGANKLLHWEAMRLFRAAGVKSYDFVGTRISAEKGSKQEALSSFKRRFGGDLKRGYMWKCPLRYPKSLAYSVGVRLLRGGDIVDSERWKLGSECN